MTQVNPTPQPINPPTLTTLLDAWKRDILTTINCARPGKIIDFDPGVAKERPATATVQIAQQQVTSIQDDGTKTYADYPLLQLVQVLFLGWGGFSITGPVAAGDDCLVLFFDRDIDNWFTNGAGLPPLSGRAHDFADACCIVGLKSGPNAIGGISTNSVQIRSNDYTGPTGAGECVEISSGKIGFYADEVIVHGRNKLVQDAGGTGSVITPSSITSYTQGVPGSTVPPSPPEVPT